MLSNFFSRWFVVNHRSFVLGKELPFSGMNHLYSRTSSLWLTTGDSWLTTGDSLSTTGHSVLGMNSLYSGMSGLWLGTGSSWSTTNGSFPTTNHSFMRMSGYSLELFSADSFSIAIFLDSLALFLAVHTQPVEKNDFVCAVHS